MRRALALLLVSTLGGCESVRAQVGLGFGLGAHVEVPYTAHVGLCVGSYEYRGRDYGAGAHAPYEEEHFALLVLHAEREVFALEEGGAASRERHSCLGVVPFAADLLMGRDPGRSAALELCLSLLVVSFRVGWNPGFLE